MQTINRRAFMKAGAAGLGGMALAPQGAAQSGPMGRSPRHVLPMNRNWLYGGRATAGCAAPDFDDSKFQRVTIPHTNQMFPWHSFNEKDFQFVSIYRRHFTPPRELEGRRVFVDFAGVMTAATVTINGHKLGEYRGGYTPFSFDLTPHLKWDGANVLAVEVDSTERADIPPFGDNIDYLTFGGIYREVALRAVAPMFIENIYAQPLDVLKDSRRVEVKCYLSGDPASRPLNLKVEVLQGNRTVAVNAKEGITSPGTYTVTLESPAPFELWDLDQPKLYTVIARLEEGGRRLDEYAVRIGFREARFTPTGFMLNGKHIKLRGLNRHQTFPYVGGAMPARVQRRDAQILKQELQCNIVRTSHYPQSPHFLDACDEVGLLVFEEIPGWQHIGDQAWQDLAVRNVEQMVKRDWNHPSIVLWGVRINESRDNHDFYTRTNAVAHDLDPSRQTGGVRNFAASELLEDVFTRNDFGFPLLPPNHPLYLNTEFNGHMFPTKRYDNVDRVMEHVLRYARVYNQLYSDDRYAGGIGWCAFDYNTHANFGSGDKICYHGVSDIFRIAKPAGMFYRSQCDPREEIVLEPCFNWSQGDQSEGTGIKHAVIVSNCDHLKIYVAGRHMHDVDPDRKNYPHLPHPPFIVGLTVIRLEDWGDLRIDGYLEGKLVISKTMPANDYDRQLHVEPDDRELMGDGIDATRVVLRVTNEHGGARPFSSASIALRLEGPGEIIGENPFALSGGVGAVWVRSKETAGTIVLYATHPYLGEQRAEIRVQPAPPERI